MIRKAVNGMKADQKPKKRKRVRVRRSSPPKGKHAQAASKVQGY